MLGSPKDIDAAFDETAQGQLVELLAQQQGCPVVLEDSPAVDEVLRRMDYLGDTKMYMFSDTCSMKLMASSTRSSSIGERTSELAI